MLISYDRLVFSYKHAVYVGVAIMKTFKTHIFDQVANGHKQAPMEDVIGFVYEKLPS